jgi:outer membrane lipoprotein-sorting protein
MKMNGLTWTASVTSVEDGSETKVRYLIRVRENNAVAEALSPPRNKGELLLFNDRTMWFFKPGLKKPVSISPRQKLMGMAANGDIASTHYARDYDGTLVGEETVRGQPAWKLELKAKAKNVTYDRIRYWVSKSQKLGIRAEFLTLAGETFKVAELDYKNTMSTPEGTYPFVSHMVISDHLNPANKTIFDYENPKGANFPMSLFNVNNLAR